LGEPNGKRKITWQVKKSKQLQKEKLTVRETLLAFTTGTTQLLPKIFSQKYEKRQNGI